MLSFLKKQRKKIKWIEGDLVKNKLIIKVHFGIFKTKGFEIKGEKEIAFAIERLLLIREKTGIHVKRPRIVSPISSNLARRLKAAFT